MAQRGTDAAAIQLRQRASKARILQLGIALVVLPAAVRRAEVRKRALYAQVRELRKRRKLRQLAVLAVGKKADAPHAGVELEVDVQDIVRAAQALLERAGVIERVNFLRQVHKDHRVGVLWRRIAQNQDRRADTAAAELHRLLQVRHCKILAAELRERTAHGYSAVPVGIRLDNT